MPATNELNLVVKYANEKGGSTDGQLVIDSVEMSVSRDNRINHGIGNEDPSMIQEGNKEYTISTEDHMNDAAARVVERLFAGDAVEQEVYVTDPDVGWKDQATGMVWNDVTLSSSDGGDTTVSIDADLFGLKFDYTGA